MLIFPILQAYLTLLLVILMKFFLSFLNGLLPAKEAMEKDRVISKKKKKKSHLSLLIFVTIPDNI